MHIQDSTWIEEYIQAAWAGHWDTQDMHQYCTWGPPFIAHSYGPLRSALMVKQRRKEFQLESWLSSQLHQRPAQKQPLKTVVKKTLPKGRHLCSALDYQLWMEGDGYINEFISQLIKCLEGRRMKVKDLRYKGLELRHITGIWEWKKVWKSFNHIITSTHKSVLTTEQIQSNQETKHSANTTQPPRCWYNIASGMK